MTPEQKAREQIDAKLIQSGWLVQDVKQLNPGASIGVAVREFSTSTGPVDYALFVDGKPLELLKLKKVMRLKILRVLKVNPLDMQIVHSNGSNMNIVFVLRTKQRISLLVLLIMMMRNSVLVPYLHFIVLKPLRHYFIKKILYVTT